MSNLDVIRAWKDAKYRGSLSAAELARLPVHPAGAIEVTDDYIMEAGGIGGCPETTAPECTLYTFRNWRCCGCLGL